MDFYTIKTKSVKNRDGEYLEISPDFIVGNSKDLMVRGGSFYAIWDEKNQVWSTDEYDVAKLVDEDLYSFTKERFDDREVSVKNLRSFDSQSWMKFRKYVSNISNSYHQLDENITFANAETKKADYISKRLPYPLEEGDHEAWDELTEVLYSPEEKAKIEWAIGAVVEGDSKTIQKFLVFYGAPGTGKSTILNIIHQMFFEYTAVFEAKALASAHNAFSTETFKSNPLVAIQHDGDLSRIEDNTKLNSIVAHEDMIINEKYKPGYMSRVNAMLFMGTNQPVKISDARSGIIRRLIDIHPTGNKIPARQYQALIKKIAFEHGAIAKHCHDVYLKMGKHYYDTYRPMDMMYKTDAFFNFVEAHYDVFVDPEGISLKRAWTLYKEYVEEARLAYSMTLSRFREELKDYFHTFEKRKMVNGEIMSNWFGDFDKTKFQVIKEVPTDEIPVEIPPLVLDQTESIFEEEMMHQPAQYAKRDETPAKKWENVETELHDLNTKRLHYVRMPANHIVIDFDLKDEDGNKSAERNLEAASGWPATYAEFSKGGGGVHLHYIYDGDVERLDRVYSDGIEVKVFTGNSSLRRKLSKCNTVPIATISSGLPIKEKKVLPSNTIQSEKGLRDLIGRNLRKEIHPGTKPSIDFIKKILDDAYESGLPYDVTDLRGKIVAFANNSTNQPLIALKMVQQMKFKSDVKPDDPYLLEKESNADDRLVFYDVEVYPNLFVICWKFAGDAPLVRMINPTPNDVESLFKLRLVGFNNRRYDNHILYARYMGYSNEDLYKLSQKIINNERNALFGEAYNLSYTDIYDFSSKKQGLKKFEIDLGIHHVELDIPWDKPVPEEQWERVVEYCTNDVVATEATFNDRKQDFVARQILSDLSGLSVNHTTQQHTARIIFGHDKNPQSQFLYTDLSKEFPGYEFDATRKPNKSLYRDEDPSEGGYVYSEPGIYENVALLDVASMHPTSIECLNLFGEEYTKKFSALKQARMAIKHKDYKAAKGMLGGKLSPHLGNTADAEALSYALKIVINIVYGLTSAKFDNPFRDNRNVDNIVAKRGALFMIDLKHYAQEELGLQVVHIKTDSIKVVDPSQEQIDAIMNFGQKYGYDFEHEDTYNKFCLVNDAVYVAYSREHKCWEATGAQFAHPVVFKTLFSNELVDFDDYCETKQVTQGAMYLDFEHDRPAAMIPDGMQFVGRTGRFVPVVQSAGGAMLFRVKDDKAYAVTGTKGYLWLEAEMAKDLDEKSIDKTYFQSLVNSAIKQIEKFGSYDELVS